MNYLKYIERSAENLQFYLWFRSYSKRFSELPENEKSLSPEWIQDNNVAETRAPPKRFSVETAAIFKGTDFASEPKVTEGETSNPFFTPPRTPNSDLKRENGGSVDSYEVSMTLRGKTDHVQRASGAFESAGLHWKPCEFDYFVVASRHQALIVSKYLFSRTVKRLRASSPSTLPTAAPAN